MYEGFAKFYRNEIFEKLTISETGVYTKLKLAAHFKPAIIQWDGFPRQIPANSYVFSSIKFSRQLKIGVNTLKKILKTLESYQLIIFETCKTGSLVCFPLEGCIYPKLGVDPPQINPVFGERDRSTTDHGLIHGGSWVDPLGIIPQARGRSTRDHIEEKKLKNEEGNFDLNFGEEEKKVYTKEEIQAMKKDLYIKLGIRV